MEYIQNIIHQTHYKLSNQYIIGFIIIDHALKTWSKYKNKNKSQNINKKYDEENNHKIQYQNDYAIRTQTQSTKRKTKRIKSFGAGLGDEILWIYDCLYKIGNSRNTVQWMKNEKISCDTEPIIMCFYMGYSTVSWAVIVTQQNELDVIPLW